MGSRRREERITASLPVRVWGMDANGKPFTVAAKTLDVTRYGARLSEVPCTIAPGDIIGVQHGAEKGRFRVAWCGKPGTAFQGHLGLQAIDATRPIWGEALKKPAQPAPTVVAPQLITAGFEQIPLAGDIHGKSAQAAPAFGGFSLVSKPERDAELKRVARRFACNANIEMRDLATDVVLSGTMSDISLTGCYVKTSAPLPAGSELQLQIRMPEMELAPVAQVRASHPAVGMGLLFTSLSADDHYKLASLVQKMAQQETAAQAEVEPSRQRSEAADALSSVIYNVSAQIRALEKIATSQEITFDKRLLTRFRAHMEQARQTAWDVQEYLESHEQLRDPAPVLAKIESKNLKASAAILKELIADVDNNALPLDREGTTEVLAAAVQLYRRLAAMAEKRKAAAAGAS